MIGQALSDGLSDGLSARGYASLGASGGKTPGAVWAALTTQDLRWSCVSVVQVDERVASEDHADRNLCGERAASLFPGGPWPTRDFGPVGAHLGYDRFTLGLSIINRACLRVFVVTGARLPRQYRNWVTSPLLTRRYSASTQRDEWLLFG